MWRWSAEAISLAPRAPAAPAAGCHNHGLSPVQGGLNPPCASGSSGPGTGLVQRGSSLTITHANPPACQQLGNVITTGNSIERGLPLVLQSGGDGKLAVVPITGAGSVAAATTPMKMPTSKSHSLLPQTNPLTQQQQVPKVGLSQSVPPRPALAPNAVTTGAGPLQAAAMAFVMGMGGPPNGVGGIGGCSGDEQQQQQWTLFAQRMQPQAQARVLRQVQDQHRTGEGGAEMLAPAMGELADDATSSCGSKDLHARPPAVATSAADSEPALQQLRLQSGEHMKLQQQWQHKHLREHERENGEDDSVEDSEEEEEEEQEEQEQDDDEESEQEKREQDGDEQRRQHEQALLPRKRDHTGGPPPAPVVAKRSRLERLDPVEPQAAPCTIEEAGLPPPSCFHNTDHLAHHHHRQQYQHPHQLAPAGSCEPVVHLSYGSGSGGPTLLPLEGSNGRDACVCGTEGRGPGSGTLALDGHWSIRGDGLTLSIAASSPQLSWGLGCPLQSSGTGAPPLQPLQSADGGTATQLQRIIRGLPSCDGGSGRVRASYWDEMEPTYGSMGVSQEPPPPLPPSSILLLPESERDAMVVAPSTVAMEPQQLQSQPPPPPPPPPPRPTAANMSCTAADSWRRNSSSPHQSLPSQLKSQQQDYRILSPPVGGHVSLPHQIGNMPSDAAMCLGACESIAATSTTLSAPPPSALPVAGLQLPSRSLVTAFPSQRDSQKPQQPHQEAVSHEAFFGNPIGHQHQQSDGQLKHQTLQQQQQQQQQQASGCVRECPCEGSAIAAGCSSSRKRGLEPCDGDGELSGSDSRRSSHTSGGATGAAAPADANTMTATERPNDRLAFQTLQQEVTMQRYPDGVEARPSGGGEGTEFGAVPSTLYGPAPPRRVQNYVPSLSGAVRLEPPWGPPAAPLPSCPPMPVGPGVGNGIPAPQAACPCPACVAQVRHQPSYASAPKPDPVSFSGGAPAGQPPFVSTSAVAPGGGGGGMFSGAGCLPCPCEMCRRADAVMQRNSTAQSLPTTQSSLALPQHQKYHNPCCPAHHPPPPSGAAPAQYAHISTGASFGSSPRGIQLSEHLPYVTSPPPTRAGSFPDVPKGPSVSPYNRAPYTALYASEAGFTATAPACSCPACVVAVSGACTVIAAGVSSAPPAMVPAASSSGAAQRLPPAQPALCEQASTQGGQGPSISPVPGATISPPPLILPESGSTVTAPAPGTAGSSNVMSAATRPSTPWSSSLSLDGTGSSFPALASQHGPAAAGPPPQQTCPQPPASTPPPPAYLRAPLPYSEMYAPRPPETSSLGPHLFPPHPYRHQQQPSAPCQLPEPQLQDLHNISTCARGSGPLQQRNVRHCPALRQPNPRWPQHPLGSYSERQLLDPHASSHPLPHPRYQPAPCTACVSHMGPQEPEQRPQYLGAVGQGASAAKKYDYLRPVNLQTASPAPLKQPAMPPVLPSPNFARSPPITAGTSPSAMAVLSNCTNPSCVGDCTGYNANSSAVTVPLTHGQQPDGTGSSHGTVGRLEAPRKSLCSTPGFDVRGVPLPVLPPRLQSQATAAGATDPGVTMPHRQALQPAPMPRHHPQPSPPESLVERFQSDAAAFAQASAAASPGPVCGICCGCGAPLPVATPTAAADMAGFWQPQPCGAPAVSPITQTMVDGLYPPQAPRVGPSEAAGPVPYPGSLCGEAATRDCAAVLPGALTRGGEHCPSAPPVTEPGCSGTGACKAWSQHPQPHVMSSHYIQQTETPKRGMPPGYLPSPALVATVTTESGQDFSSLDGVDPQMPRFHMAQGSVGAQLTHRSVAPDEEAAMWAEDPISLPWPRRSSRRL
ncbi:hypothetical protein Vretifemale_5321 [Volvox reticuliferus]|uniref:Uncharacterized protein n=1 Tax=Volvox reticuliferus TaxID=1737510 RepID=A0A8J4C669_9CHLO|nr:hypothetical protein Vretifemale_5321 [Volvox reticuliferus]